MKKIYIILVLALFHSLGVFSQTAEVELTASIDNTIFKGSNLSNGLGEYIFTGTTDKNVIKRALLQFDLTDAVPEGIRVDSVRIILHPTRVKPGSTQVQLHVITTEWGEGTSRATDGDGKGAAATAGDATWTFAKYSKDPWVNSGGDFIDTTISAKTTVTLGKATNIKADRITRDVNNWLQDSIMNYGWIIIGDETKTATSVKFASKDHSDNTLKPKLKLYYQGVNSVSEVPGMELKLSVYQGQELDQIYIRNSGEPGTGFVEIYSITGSRIFTSQMELFRGDNFIPSGIQGPGIYLYRILMNGHMLSGKLSISDR